VALRALPAGDTALTTDIKSTDTNMLKFLFVIALVPGSDDL
jgi:hypothetical protein